jgi:hypothetical protein
MEKDNSKIKRRLITLGVLFGILLLIIVLFFFFEKAPQEQNNGEGGITTISVQSYNETGNETMTGTGGSTSILPGILNSFLIWMAIMFFAWMILRPSRHDL